MVDMERHGRHLVLPNVGYEGQKKLAAARVLVIGAGGLGSPAEVVVHPVAWDASGEFARD